MTDGILAAAIEIAGKEGWPNVTMRKIADRIEYSHGAIYKYFPSREAILAEVLRRGYEELCAAANAALPRNGGDFSVLVDVLWRFALSKPVVYQAMHGLSGVRLRKPGAPDEAKRVLDLMIAALRQAAPNASHAQLEATAESIWSTAHGFISLQMVDQVGGGQRRAIRLSQQAASDLIDGLRSRSR